MQPPASPSILPCASSKPRCLQDSWLMAHKVKLKNREFFSRMSDSFSLSLSRPFSFPCFWNKRKNDVRLTKRRGNKSVLSRLQGGRGAGPLSLCSSPSSISEIPTQIISFLQVPNFPTSHTKVTKLETFWMQKTSNINVLTENLNHNFLLDQLISFPPKSV